MMRNISYFLFLQKMKLWVQSQLVVLVVLMVQNTVSGAIMGDLSNGWHYLVTGISARDLQPTRTPRQIIGSR